MPSAVVSIFLRVIEEEETHVLRNIPRSFRSSTPPFSPIDIKVLRTSNVESKPHLPRRSSPASAAAITSSLNPSPPRKPAKIASASSALALAMDAGSPFAFFGGSLSPALPVASGGLRREPLLALSAHTTAWRWESARECV